MWGSSKTTKTSSKREDELFKLLRLRSAAGTTITTDVQLDRIRQLVEADPECLERSCYAGGWMPLEYAIRHNLAPEILVHLIEQSLPEVLRVPGYFGPTPLISSYLFHAKRNDNVDLSVVRALVFKHPKALRTIDPGTGRLPLHEACWLQAPVDVLTFLMKQYPQALSARDCQFLRLPLHWALLQPSPRTVSEEAVLLLLQWYPEATARLTRRGRLPLHSASANRASFRIIRELVRVHPESVNTPDPDLWFPFHFAAAYNSDTAVVAYLMDKFQDGRNGALRAADRHGWLPLHCSVRCRASLDLVRWLVKQYPAALASRDNHDALPLHCLSRGEATSELWENRMYELRMSRGGLITYDNTTSIWSAGHEVVEYLLSKDPDAASTRDCLGRLVMHRACAGRAPHRVISLLIRAFADALTCPRRNGRLPLHDACFHFAPPEVIRLLIRTTPAALLSPAFDGRLPLHDACASGREQVIDEVINANPEALSVATKAEGLLPIHEACAAGFAFLRQHSLLIDRFPEGILLADRKGRLALHHLCRSGFPGLASARRLLERFPEAARMHDNCGRLPLHYIFGALSACSDIVELLLDHHPLAAQMPDSDGGHGSLPLHLACASSRVSPKNVVLLLESFPGAVARVDGSGRTPLMVACENRSQNTLELLETIKILVEAQVAWDGRLLY